MKKTIFTMLSAIKKLFNNIFKRETPSLCYISVSEMLPPPMSIDEEQYYLARLSEGNADARSSLIERNLRLVVYIAKRFDNTAYDMDDLISVGSIGLIKAVSSFDPEKNIKLATFASKCIENEILMYLRKASRTKNEVSFDEPLNVDADGNELQLTDILGSEDEMVYNEMERKLTSHMLCSAIYSLKARERTIIEMRYGLLNRREQTQKEVADSLGISQSYISRLEKRIMKKLFSQVAEEG